MQRIFSHNYIFKTFSIEYKLRTTRTRQPFGEKIRIIANIILIKTSVEYLRKSDRI